MGREEFIDDLIGLLVRIDRGMEEFTEPLPVDAEKGVMQAIISFGEEILPQLHSTFKTLWSQTDAVHLIDILGVIGNPSSIPYLIEFHSQYASFLGGIVAVRAMKNIGTEEVYTYFGSLIVRHKSGENIFNSGAEIPIVCEALGDWNDERAVSFLEMATTIHNPNHMPETAIRQLIKYPGTHEFLNQLAEREVSLKPLIDKIIHENNPS